MKGAAGRARSDCPVVGIGASAGGLEALGLFFENVPQDSGAAFVVIQHLDPSHPGMLPELLQRSTSLPVRQITDRMTVAPNHVYVIPPGVDVAILRDKLHLTEPAAPRGLRLPIDFFFRSLADDRQERAIGVVLSGMGSDGTAGLRAIKERAGLGLAQDPASAKFDSMPVSAVDAGLADIVATAEELPGKILAYLRHAPLLASPKVVLDTKILSGLEKIVLLLRERTGHDFSRYRKSTLYRRIERRMGIHQLDRVAHYARHLQENPAEVDLLFKELLIGVTQFFRDPGAWERLQADVLPPLLASRSSGRPLRAWVAGCATGEEAYSLAMVCREALDALRPQGAGTVQIFATDLDRDAVDQARQGVYPADIGADVSPERLNRFFVRTETGFRVGQAIREMVVFATQDVIRDPPFTKLDILSCRNLLIYLEPALQQQLLALFHYSLLPGGALFLGSAESLGAAADYFATVAAKERLFRRRAGGSSPEIGNLPGAFVPRSADAEAESVPSRPPVNLELLTDKWVLQHHAPAAVLVTDAGDILYASARTGKYLEPAVGKANLNVFAMAREGLRHELASAFQKVRREGGTVVVRGLAVGTNGGEQTVDLTVQALTEPAALKGKFLIVLADAPMPAKPAGKGRRRPASGESAQVAQLTRALAQAREEAQSTREEAQASQEELKSANEELQSTNEELQSTNEELTTSREEMQSLNEELQTLNAELSLRVDALSSASADMKNLLNSTDIATVFLDGELRVRRFTDRARNIVQLIPGDVGRPFTDLTSTLLYPELVADAREVLRTLAAMAREVSSRDGRWYQVRILPYRTLEDRIDGVVITCTDITAAKRLEAELRAGGNDRAETP